MKDLRRRLARLFEKYWPFLAILALSTIFFYPVWFQNKVPLPADALVGAHVPFTELSWEEYPAGVPIKNLEISDSFSQFYPWRGLVGDFWREGKVPLWNPYMFSGTPFLATLHSAALYPANILYLFLSDASAWTGLVFLQVSLAAFFMYLFLNELGISKLASLFGSIAFALSGYMIAWLEFATGGHAGLWLPLLLLFEHRLVSSGGKVWLLPISAVFFAIFTAGDFQVPFYISATYVLFGSFLVIRKRSGRTLLFRGFLKVLFGLVFGVLLSSPQLFPTLELFTQSIRADDPYIAEYFYGLMHWEKLANFIWPDFFGNVVTGNYWGKFGFHEYMAFTGVSSLVFAIYGFLVKKTSEEKFFWILLAIFFLFLFPTPLGFLPYRLKIPALSTSSASRIIFLVDFCLATLAAYGFSKWMKENKGGILKVVGYLLVITSGVGLGLAVSVYLIKSGATNLVVPDTVKNLKVSLRNMVPSTAILIALGTLFFINEKIVLKLKFKRISKYFLAIIPYVVLLLMVVELSRFAWKNTPFSPRKFVFPETKIIEFLQDEPQPFRIAGGIPTNLFMPYKLSSAEGYDPIYPARNAEWLSAVNFGHIKSPSRRYGLFHSFSSPLINYANVGYVVDYKKNIYGQISERGELAPGIAPPRYKEVFTEGRIKVFENGQSFPRVWLSTNYKVVSNREEIIDTLLAQDAQAMLIVVESDPGLSVKGEDLNYRVSSFSRRHNRIDFKVQVDKNALLFLSESFYPGWRAFIDGEETQILRANYLFQTIAVPQGEYRIKFIYDPKSFRMGLTASVATAVFLIAISSAGNAYGRFKKTRI